MRRIAPFSWNVNTNPLLFRGGDCVYRLRMGIKAVVREVVDLLVGTRNAHFDGGLRQMGRIANDLGQDPNGLLVAFGDGVGGATGREAGIDAHGQAGDGRLAVADDLAELEDGEVLDLDAMGFQNPMDGGGGEIALDHFGHQGGVGTQLELATAIFARRGISPRSIFAMISSPFCTYDTPFSSSLI